MCMEPSDDLNRSHITIHTEEPPPPDYTAQQSPAKEPESLLRWFDKNCEKELNKRRNIPLSPKINVIGQRGLSHPAVVESMASGIDISCRLRSAQNTDLLDAVEKFAKAEAMVAFEGAVRAAENAAASVAPEYAEEAAMHSARTFQAELTAEIKESVPAVDASMRPIEVVGYVGITKPRKPKKS